MDLAPKMDAPRLSLATPDGQVEVPAAGRAQALFFFKVECPTCPLAAPAVERLRRVYPALEVVAVSQNALAAARPWLIAHGLAATVALEGESYPASNAFGLLTVPTLVLIGPDGRIAAVKEGWTRAGYDELAAQAADLLGAPPVKIAPVDGPPFQPG
jgi:thiol-disulfide isomerase/thioredoxin